MILPPLMRKTGSITARGLVVLSYIHYCVVTTHGRRRMIGKKRFDRTVCNIVKHPWENQQIPIRSRELYD